MAISYNAGTDTITLSGIETFDALATFLAANPAAGSASPAVLTITSNLSFASDARLNRGSSVRNVMVFGVSGVVRRMTSVVFTSASQGILDFGTDGVLILQGMGTQDFGESQLHIQLRAARLDVYVNHDSAIAVYATADIFYRSDNSIQAVNVSELLRVVYNNSYTTSMGLLLTQTAPLGAVEFLRGSGATAPATLFINGNDGLIVPPFTFIPEIGSESTTVNWGRNSGTGSWVMNQPTITGTGSVEFRTWNGSALEVKNLVYPSGWNKVIRFIIAAGQWENPTKTFSARYGLKLPEFDFSGWALRVLDDQGTQISTKLSSDGQFGERFVEWKFATAIATGATLDVLANTRTNTRLRARRYGFADLDLSWAQFDAPVNFLAPPVAANANLTLTEAQAAAITGISLVASGSTGGTVTITENVTASDLWHYYRQWIATLANFGSEDTWQFNGAEVGTGTWNVVIDGATYTGDMTTTGIITLANGAQFIGTRTDENGTIAPPVFQSVTVSNGVAGTLLLIQDVTNSADPVTLYFGTPATWPHTWTDSADYAADREIRVRAAYQSGTEAKLFVDEVIGTSTYATPALSYQLNQEDDTVYNTRAQDGAAVSGIAINDASLLIEVTTGTIEWGALYAYEVYWLATEAGMIDEGRIITALDSANYVFEGAWKIKNMSSPSVPLVITGGWGRSAADNTTQSLIDTTGGTIFAAPDQVYTTVISTDYSAMAAALLSAAQVSPIHSDVRKMNSATMYGTGVAEDQWRGTP
jgi:hypothetical protein